MKIIDLEEAEKILEEDYSLIIDTDKHDSELIKAKEEVIKQYIRERDLAISQLEEIGASFGLNMVLWLNEHDNVLLDKVAKKIKEDCGIYFDNDYSSSNQEPMYLCSEIDKVIADMKAEVEQ